MPRPKRSASSRTDSTLKLLLAEIRELREMIGTLQVESLTHLRRIGELHHEVDLLKRAMGQTLFESASRAQPDGPMS
jgi:hypothetical protein